MSLQTERAEVARLHAELHTAQLEARTAQRAADIANQQLAALQQQPVQQPAQQPVQPQNLNPAPNMSQRAQVGSQQAMFPPNIAPAGWLRRFGKFRSMNGKVGAASQNP